ncbi:hypothetical protein AB0K00_42450 [Dactylosporangium sp. NPDC049525]|uniref:hypothetical protein n=1 Tax=Dactylosporangium sp. NPDC049525 TaxID=3154730 RepID=UPI00343CDBAA
MLRLTRAQAELLLAMTGPRNAYVKQDFAWIDHRSFPLTDLYALRAAGLVRAIRSIRVARGFKRFEVTDRDIAEALRLSGDTPARQEELQQ